MKILSINSIHHLFCQRNMKMYLLDQIMIKEKRTFCFHKNIILDLLLKKSKNFEWQVSLLFFLNNKKSSSHVDQISKHINSSNQNIHSYEQMIKIIVNLLCNKCKNNNTSYFQLTRIQNYLFVSTIDTLEKDLSNVESKSDMRKVRTSSVNSSLKLFYCSILAMYNRFKCA